MAKLTKVPVVQEFNYNLELSEKEAQTLKCILGKIAGHPERTARKYSDSIFLELCKHKVQTIYPSYDHVSEHDNGITFTEDYNI